MIMIMIIIIILLLMRIIMIPSLEMFYATGSRHLRLLSAASYGI